MGCSVYPSSAGYASSVAARQQSGPAGRGLVDARALIDALEDGVADSLTLAFRDRALPVLQALAQ